MLKNYNQFYFLTSLIAILLSGTTQANNRLPKFETTRMKSTGGAGVASILIDEATLLNPATIAYYKQASLYYQHNGHEASRTGNSDSSNDYSSTSIIASDSKGLTGGSISYNTIEVNGEEAKRISGAIGRPVGKTSSLGSTFNYTKEKTLDDNGQLVENEYKQVTFGIAHAINEDFTLGVVVNDPFQEKAEDSNAIVGIQYVYEGFISLMLDGGTNYNEDLSGTLLWRAGSQIKLLDDFFLRFGTFNDKGKQEKGSGAGVGWMQPKLVIEFAIQNIDRLPSTVLNQTGEEIKETSFSLSYRF